MTYAKRTKPGRRPSPDKVKAGRTVMHPAKSTTPFAPGVVYKPQARKIRDMDMQYNPVSCKMEPVTIKKAAETTLAKPYGFTLARPRAGDPVIRKTLTLVDGVITKTALANGLNWNFEVKRFANFAGFREALFAAERAGNCCILRSLPLGNLAYPAVRRKPNFEGTGNLFALDLDSVPLPEGMATPTTAAGFEALAKSLFNSLPDLLSGIGTVVQFTAGMGVDPDLRARLWFVAERPVTQNELLCIFGDKPSMIKMGGGWGDIALDNSVWRPLQPNYIAAPQCGPGVADPVPGARLYSFGDGLLTAADIDDELDLHGYVERKDERTFANAAHPDFSGEDDARAVAHFADQLRKSAREGGLVPGEGGRIHAYRKLADEGMDVGCSREHVEDTMKEWCASPSPTRPGETNFVDDGADTAETCAEKFLTFEGSRKSAVGSRWEWVIDEIARKATIQHASSFGSIPDDEIADEAAADDAATVIWMDAERAKRAANKGKPADRRALEAGATPLCTDPVMMAKGMIWDAVEKYWVNPALFSTRVLALRQLRKDADAFEGRLPFEAGSVGLIIGQTGTAKSAVAIELCAAMAMNRDAIGGQWKNVSSGPIGCLYINGESNEINKDRVQAQILRGTLSEDAPFLMCGMPTDERSFEEIFKAAKYQMRQTFNRELKICVVDTFASVYELESENENAAISKIIREMKIIAKRMGMMIIIVHHAGKNAALGARGGSAFGCDAEFQIDCAKNEREGQAPTYTARTKKHKAAGEQVGSTPFGVEAHKLGSFMQEREGKSAIERTIWAVVVVGAAVCALPAVALKGHKGAIMEELRLHPGGTTEDALQVAMEAKAGEASIPKKSFGVVFKRMADAKLITLSGLRWIEAVAGDHFGNVQAYEVVDSEEDREAA